MLIFSIWANTLRTVSRTPVPQAGRLADGRGRSPVLSFPNSAQVPVDLRAHIRYTGLAFSFVSQTKNKATSEVWKPFSGSNPRSFLWFFLQRALQLYLSPKALFVIIHGKVSFLILIYIIVLIYMANIKFGLVHPPRKNKNFIKFL